MTSILGLQRLRVLPYVLVLLTASCAAVFAQSDPSTQPLVQQADIKYLGSFRLPSAGTANGSWGGDADAFNYGGPALTILPNGQMLVGCHRQHDKAAVIAIPAIGGTAKVVIPCTNIGLGNIGPGDKTLGGGLVYNGRLVMSQYIEYDATAAANASHTWRNLDLTGSAPWQRVGSVGPGFVGGYMGLIPDEWRTSFGGPAFTGICCLSIISRTSRGPDFFVFNPDDIGRVNPAPAQELLNYPDGQRALGGPLAGENRGPANPLYNWSTNIRGAAFIPGTRSILFIGRHGMGTPCYGEASQCGNDPVDRGKGNHAYPYVHQAWAYDALDLLKVKAKQIQPWQVQPYAILKLPDMANNSAQMWGGAAYDPATKRLYIATDFYESPRIHVYEINAGTVPPPPPVNCRQDDWKVVGEPFDIDPSTGFGLQRYHRDTLVEPANGGTACGASEKVESVAVPIKCTVTDFRDWAASGDWSACVEGQQTRTEIRTRDIVVTPKHGGEACPVLEEVRQVEQACTPPPPPPLTWPLICQEIDGETICRGRKPPQD